MQQIGEDVAEQLDVIPAKFFVRRHIRPKYACRHCETVVAAPIETFKWHFFLYAA
jgi:transposase